MAKKPSDKSSTSLSKASKLLPSRTPAELKTLANSEIYNSLVTKLTFEEAERTETLKEDYSWKKSQRERNLRECSQIYYSDDNADVSSPGLRARKSRKNRLREFLKEQSKSGERRPKRKRKHTKVKRQTQRITQRGTKILENFLLQTESSVDEGGDEGFPDSKEENETKEVQADMEALPEKSQEEENITSQENFEDKETLAIEPGKAVLKIQSLWRGATLRGQFKEVAFEPLEISEIKFSENLAIGQKTDKEDAEYFVSVSVCNICDRKMLFHSDFPIDNTDNPSAISKPHFIPGVGKNSRLIFVVYACKKEAHNREFIAQGIIPMSNLTGNEPVEVTLGSKVANIFSKKSLNVSNVGQGNEDKIKISLRIQCKVPNSSECYVGYVKTRFKLPATGNNNNLIESGEKEEEIPEERRSLLSYCFPCLYSNRVVDKEFTPDNLKSLNNDSSSPKGMEDLKWERRWISLYNTHIHVYQKYGDVTPDLEIDLNEYTPSLSDAAVRSGSHKKSRKQQIMTLKQWAEDSSHAECQFLAGKKEKLFKIINNICETG